MGAPWACHRIRADNSAINSFKRRNCLHGSTANTTPRESEMAWRLCASWNTISHPFPGYQVCLHPMARTCTCRTGPSYTYHQRELLPWGTPTKRNCVETMRVQGCAHTKTAGRNHALRRTLHRSKDNMVIFARRQTFHRTKPMPSQRTCNRASRTGLRRVARSAGSAAAIIVSRMATSRKP